MSAPAVDLSILISNSGGDEAFVREIITMSVEQADGQIRDLHTYCIDGPSDDWMHTAHALKGTAATLGAEDMRKLCEFAQKQMLDATADARRAQVGRIAQTYGDVRAALREMGYL